MKLDADQFLLFSELWHSKTPYKAIAERLSKSTRTIEKYCKELGWKRHGHRKPRIVELASRGLSSGQIGKLVGITPGAVRVALMRERRKELT